MATHTSATTREEASHVTQTPHVNQTTRTATINNALEQRAQAEQPINALEPTLEAREPKIEALAEIICGAGDEAAGALFVLMGTLECSTHPEVLAHTVKHLAFTRCGELNLFGMVDAQLAVLEEELLTHGTSVS